MRPPLTDSEYRRIREWLIEEFGLKFGAEKRDILRSRLEPYRAQHGFETFEQLLFHLKFHPERESEWQRVIPFLTNNESYFFREPAQLEVLRDEVLPELVERLTERKRHEIRILSAGCASGEEPYTLAMTVLEEASLAPGFRFRITGIDLDPEALQRARNGVYTENAFRRTADDIRARYFKSKDGGKSWTIDRKVREMVRFEGANLSSDSWPSRFPKQDVIFCRNVLIYFDEAAMRQAVASFYSALEPGGSLFLGHAESLSRIPTRFQAVRRPGAIFYRRPEAANV